MLSTNKIKSGLPIEWSKQRCRIFILYKKMLRKTTTKQLGMVNKIIYHAPIELILTPLLQAIFSSLSILFFYCSFTVLV